MKPLIYILFHPGISTILVVILYVTASSYLDWTVCSETSRLVLLPKGLVWSSTNTYQHITYSKALRCTFFGEWKNSCSSNSCNFCYLIGWKARWSKNRAAQGFYYINSFSSNIFGPNSKTCTCKVRAAWGRVSWGLTVIYISLFKIFSSQVFLFGNLIHNDVIKVATALKLPKQLAWQREGKTWGNNFYCSFFSLPQTGWPNYSHTISKAQQ